MIGTKALHEMPTTQEVWQELRRVRRSISMMRSDLGRLYAYESILVDRYADLRDAATGRKEDE